MSPKCPHNLCFLRFWGHEFENEKKYLDSSIVLGGKTGKWKHWVHDMRFLEIDGKRDAVVVLTEAGESEKVGIMFGGLVREYLLD